MRLPRFRPGLWQWLSVVAASWAAGFGLLRFTIAAPENCGDIDHASAAATIDAAVDWFGAALLEDGRYVYEFDLETGGISNDYNLVRHAGVTMSLYQLAAEHGDAEALEIADGALGYMLDNLGGPADAAAFARAGEFPKLGSSALMLASLNLRRDATGSGVYDDLMRSLGRFLVLMQREDGSFLAFWDPNTGEPVPGTTSRYATGEAFWALAQLHRHFPGEGWDEPAIAVADYLATQRDEDEGFPFPPWPDQWAAYGLSEMGTWPEDALSETHIAYARTLAERFGFLVRVESRRGDDDPLRLVNGPQTRGAGMGTWVEALTSLWRLSRADGRLGDLEEDLGDRAICGAAILAGRQYEADDAKSGVDADLVAGAWFRDGVTRMDDQQHALSGILRAVVILDERAE